MVKAGNKGDAPISCLIEPIMVAWPMGSSSCCEGESKLRCVLDDLDEVRALRWGAGDLDRDFCLALSGWPESRVPSRSLTFCLKDSISLRRVSSAQVTTGRQTSDAGAGRPGVEAGFRQRHATTAKQRIITHLMALGRVRTWLRVPLLLHSPPRARQFRHGCSVSHLMRCTRHQSQARATCRRFGFVASGGFGGVLGAEDEPPCARLGSDAGKEA